METITSKQLDSIIDVAEMQHKVIYDHAILNGFSFKGLTRPPRLSPAQRQRIKNRLGSALHGTK